MSIGESGVEDKPKGGEGRGRTSRRKVSSNILTIWDVGNGYPGKGEGGNPGVDPLQASTELGVGDDGGQRQVIQGDLRGFRASPQFGHRQTTEVRQRDQLSPSSRLSLFRFIRATHDRLPRMVEIND